VGLLIRKGGIVSETKTVENAFGLCRFIPYPGHKNSGVEWLGKIPTHWEARRMKYAAALNPPGREVRKSPSDLEVSFVPMELVGEYGGMDLSRVKPLAEVAQGYTYFRDGDVVIAKITPCFENGKGARAMGLTNGIAFGTTELHVLRAHEVIEGRFLFYLTLSHGFRKLGEAEM
jgi:type I restriction enzyme S subunit